MGCQEWDDTILDGVLDRDERYSVIMIEEGVRSLGFYAILRYILVRMRKLRNFRDACTISSWNFWRIN